MRRARNISVIVLAGLAVWSVRLQAGEDAASTLRSTLEQRFPDVKIYEVGPTPIPGIYEVFTGDRMAYADKSGDYLILGKMVETRTRRDLSAEHLDAHRAIDFHALPLGRAIKIVKGNGTRQLAVFEDPDCPYCRQLEQALRSVGDVTEYVFLYPLDNLHPEASKHAAAIWCAPDRSAAWTAWMTARTAPAGDTCAGEPLEEIRSLAASLHVEATPTLFLESGRRIGGAVSAEELQALLGPSAPDQARR